MFKQSAPSLSISKDSYQKLPEELQDLIKDFLVPQLKQVGKRKAKELHSAIIRACEHFNGETSSLDEGLSSHELFLNYKEPKSSSGFFSSISYYKSINDVIDMGIGTTNSRKALAAYNQKLIDDYLKGASVETVISFDPSSNGVSGDNDAIKFPTGPNHHPN